MELTLPNVVEFLAIVLVAGTAQGASGFGFGLVAAALMPLLMELRQATPLVALLASGATLTVLWRLRRHCRPRRLGSIIVGCLAGVPIGVLGLVRLPQDLLLRVLGIVLLGVAVQGLRSPVAEQPTEGPETEGVSPEVPPGPPRGLGQQVVGFLVGVSSGALGGAFNTGGPPLVAYVYRQPWSKEERTCALQVLFSISLAARIVMMSLTGLMTLDVVVRGALGMPFVLVGVAAGQMLFHRLGHRQFGLVVVLLLAVMGTKLLVVP